MPRISKQDATHTQSADGYDGRYEELGGYTVGFETFSADADPGELFKGLPDDRCQCAHWGYVIKGEITYKYADHAETITAGQAYYAPPGHTPVVTAGTEIVEFSPTIDLNATMQVVTANMGGGA